MNGGNQIRGFMVILLCGLIHFAAVFKKDDPILKTQTNPITYKEKREEIKEGEKGAPSPSYKHYPKEEFLTENPVEKEPASDESEMPEVEEVWGDEEIEFMPFDEEVDSDKENPDEEALDFWQEEEAENALSQKGVKE